MGERNRLGARRFSRAHQRHASLFAVREESLDGERRLRAGLAAGRGALPPRTRRRRGLPAGPSAPRDGGSSRGLRSRSRDAAPLARFRSRGRRSRGGPRLRPEGHRSARAPGRAGRASPREGDVARRSRRADPLARATDRDLRAPPNGRGGAEGPRGRRPRPRRPPHRGASSRAGGQPRGPEPLRRRARGQPRPSERDRGEPRRREGRTRGARTRARSRESPARGAPGRNATGAGPASGLPALAPRQPLRAPPTVGRRIRAAGSGPSRLRLGGPGCRSRRGASRDADARREPIRRRVAGARF